MGLRVGLPRSNFNIERAIFHKPGDCAISFTKNKKIKNCFNWLLKFNRKLEHTKVLVQFQKRVLSNSIKAFRYGLCLFNTKQIVDILPKQEPSWKEPKLKMQSVNNFIKLQLDCNFSRTTKKVQFSVLPKDSPTAQRVASSGHWPSKSSLAVREKRKQAMACQPVLKILQ